MRRSMTLWRSTARSTVPLQAPQFKSRASCLIPQGMRINNEQATLKNVGSQPISLASWRLRGLKGKMWSLDELGTLQSGEQKGIKDKIQPMAMNNGGDTIDLVDPTGKLIQSV